MTSDICDISNIDLEHVQGGFEQAHALAAVGKLYHSAGLPPDPTTRGYFTSIFRNDPAVPSSTGLKVGGFSISGREGRDVISGDLLQHSNTLQAVQTGRVMR